MDSFSLYKPVGWTNNATARASQLSSFEPNATLGDNWIDTFGIDGGITSSVCLCFATPYVSSFSLAAALFCSWLGHSCNLDSLNSMPNQHMVTCFCTKTSSLHSIAHQAHKLSPRQLKQLQRKLTQKALCVCVVVVQISTYLLNVLQANPSMYEGLQNATLVQNINAVDTLENTLQVLNPAMELLYLPEVKTLYSLIVCHC